MSDLPYFKMFKRITFLQVRRIDLFFKTLGEIEGPGSVLFILLFYVTTSTLVLWEYTNVPGHNSLLKGILNAKAMIDKGFSVR